MVDTLSKERRSALMKQVKQKNTAPELIVRKALHKRGLRYKIADRKLPGRPDLSFPRYRAAVFVHGCFWHGHDCRAGRPPTTNTDFWVPKIEGNRERDLRKEKALRDLGWRVFTVWQCELEADADARLRDALAATIRAAPSSPDSKPACVTRASSSNPPSPGSDGRPPYALGERSAIKDATRRTSSSTIARRRKLRAPPVAGAQAK